MNTYKRHWFPPEIISYAVWLYYRFSLSHRDIEDLLAERSVTVSHESIRLLVQQVRPYLYAAFEAQASGLLRYILYR